MAKVSQTVSNAPPSGELIFPDFGEFQEPAQAPEIPGGTVVGLDYTAWAAAIVDLGDKPDRVAATRIRLKAKGYRPLGGNPLVTGYNDAEVWVIPRESYEKRREMRKAKIAAAVRNGDMTEFALDRGITTTSRSR